MITLHTELEKDPVLTKAMLIHGVVSDLLFQSGFEYASSTELIDIAVVGTGLGAVQNQIEFVKQTGAYWDSTQWLAVPRPFLNRQALAYVIAVGAWIRGDAKPVWANELASDLKKSMGKSLKYLFSSDDSFFCVSKNGRSNLDKTPEAWLQIAENNTGSRHLIALRHVDDANEGLFINNLQSQDRAALLHTINAFDRLSNEHTDNDSIIEELNVLAGHRDDEVRAKTICVLARLGKLNEITIDLAGKMLESNTRFVLFAGLFALSSLDSVPDSIIPAANRGFVRSLRSCDYEFVNLFASAFNRWIDEPENHFEILLQNDSPEYLEIAVEALTNIRQQLVSLG